MPDPARRPRTALVLSGGGSRGAYEVGVLAGMMTVLELRPDDPPPFTIFVGTSVGAINAVWLASHADAADLEIEGLVAVWEGLRLKDYLIPSFFGWRSPLRRLRGKRESEAPNHAEECFFDPAALEELFDRITPWDRLHACIQSGRINALLMPALEVATGVTTIFAETTPGYAYEPSRDVHREGLQTTLSIDHVMASSAIPVLFPPRRVDDRYYYDGGLRFNTPISPAIRAGADQLVVITPLKVQRETPLESLERPGLGFLAGKALNALMLDPVQYDLSVLDRFNKIVEVLEETLSPDDLSRVQSVMAATRGLPYRRLRTLAFAPTADLGRIGVNVMRTHLDEWDLDSTMRWGLRRLVGGPEVQGEADWTSFLLLEGSVAKEFIRLGRADALARADEIRAFFR